MAHTITAPEAVIGFAHFLASLQEPLTIGGNKDGIQDIVALADQYIKANSLGAVSSSDFLTALTRPTAVNEITTRNRK
jgi:hypothetical protein